MRSADDFLLDFDMNAAETTAIAEALIRYVPEITGYLYAINKQQAQILAHLTGRPTAEILGEALADVKLHRDAYEDCLRASIMQWLKSALAQHEAMKAER